MEKKIKILHINTSLIAGGVEKILEDLLPLFNKEEKIQVDLFLLENKNKNLFEKSLKENKIKIIYSKYNNKYDIRTILEIRKMIKQYDIVHTHIFPSQLYVPISRIGLKKSPYLITTEHSTENNRRKYKILYLIEKYLYLKYDKIISISKETEVNLKKWLKISKNKKFIVIKNGINLEKFYPNNVKIEEEYFKEERKKKIITMIGRFDIQKDQPTLIRAVKEIEGVILFLVGDGPRKQEYLDLVKELKLEKKIRFLGVRRDIPEILKITDISVISSNWEGFGLVAVESMAAQKPVIASKVDGLKQIIDNEELLFERGNYKELKNKIVLLLENSVKYNESLEKIKNKISNYDLNIMKDKYLKEYGRK